MKAEPDFENQINAGMMRSDMYNNELLLFDDFSTALENLTAQLCCMLPGPGKPSLTDLNEVQARLQDVLDTATRFELSKRITMPGIQIQAAALAIRAAESPLRISYLLHTLWRMDKLAMPHVYVAVRELGSDADESHVITPVTSTNDPHRRPLAELYLIAVVTQVGWKELHMQNATSLRDASNYRHLYSWSWRYTSEDDENLCYVRTILSNMDVMPTNRVEKLLRVVSSSSVEPEPGDTVECLSLRRTMRRTTLQAVLQSTLGDEFFRFVDLSWCDALRMAHLVVSSVPCCMSGLPTLRRYKTVEDLKVKLDEVYAAQLRSSMVAFASKVRLQLFIVKQETAEDTAHAIDMERYHKFAEKSRNSLGTLFADEPARELFATCRFSPYVNIDHDVVVIDGPQIIMHDRMMFGVLWQVPTMAFTAYNPRLIGMTRHENWDKWRTFTHEHIVILTTRGVMMQEEAASLSQQVTAQVTPPKW